MLDEESRRYILNDKIIELTPSETKILSTILKHKNRIATYDVISQELYGEEKNRKTINRMVVPLRRKLNGVLEIKTKTTLGYYI